MSKHKINFIGLLSNVDSSITNMEFEHGFKAESLSMNEFMDFFSTLRCSSTSDIQRDLLTGSCISFSENRVCFITNSIEDEVETKTGNDFISALPYIEFESKLVNQYLENTLLLMRLFKEGNIRLASYYYYYLIDSKPERVASMHRSSSFSLKPYTINNNEIPEIKSFLEKTKIPFKNTLYQLALENYELSYRAGENHLAFLSLMISLETLFNPSETELTYRISRNIATLLGNKNKASSTIYEDVKKLYNKRSKLIHKGENKITTDDLILLRAYVRDSIKAMNTKGLDRDKILKILHAKGFYETLFLLIC